MTKESPEKDDPHPTDPTAHITEHSVLKDVFRRPPKPDIPLKETATPQPNYIVGMPDGPKTKVNPADDGTLTGVPRKVAIRRKFQRRLVKAIEILVIPATILLVSFNLDKSLTEASNKHSEHLADRQERLENLRYVRARASEAWACQTAQDTTADRRARERPATNDDSAATADTLGLDNPTEELGVVEPEIEHDLDRSTLEQLLDSMRNQDITDCSNMLIFPDVDLQDTTLSGLYLKQASMRESALEGVNMRGGTLEGADLFRTSLNGATIGYTAMTDIELVKASFEGTAIRGVSMTSADLSNSTMGNTTIGYTTMDTAKFAEARIENTIFQRVSMKDADLTNADFTEATMTKTSLDGAKLDFTNIHDSELTDISMTNAEIYLAQIVDSELAEVNLTGATIDTTIINGSDVCYANLSKSGTGNNTSHHAATMHLDAFDSTFIMTTFQETDFGQSRLKDTQLLGVDLRNADLSKATLQDTLILAIHDETTSWPPGYEPLPSLPKITLPSQTNTTSIGEEYNIWMEETNGYRVGLRREFINQLAQQYVAVMAHTPTDSNSRDPRMSPIKQLQHGTGCDIEKYFPPKSTIIQPRAGSQP